MSAPSQPPLTVITVALGPELPFARVLAESVREHHPEARMMVVCADGPAVEGFPAGVEVLGAADLGRVAPSADAALLAPERAGLAVLLPALERALAGPGIVVVLAPDTVLFGRVDDLLGGAAPISVLGRDVPAPPDDGLHPSVTDLEHVEPTDLGFLIFRAGDVTRELVAGWRRRLDASPWTLPEGGATSELLDELDDEVLAVLNMPPSVVAWWTLSTRGLGRDADGHLTADGARVAVLRLPEFDVALSTRLHPLLSRVRVTADPVFRELLEDVTGRLRASGAGGGRLAQIRMPDGRPLPPAMAGLMAEALATGMLEAPPSEPAGWERFYAFLNAPADWGRDLGMTRYLDALWQSRDDLRDVYPDVRGGDGAGYVGWVWVHGRDLVPDELLPPRPPHIPEDARSAGRWDHGDSPQTTDPLWGVNVAGFFRSELGLGEAARLLIAGLDAARVPALPVQGSFVPPCRQGAEFTFATPDEAPYPLNILCLNGDAIPAFARETGDAFFAGRRTIALWWWEVGELPSSWQESFRWVDEVWVATDHIRDLIAPDCPVPVTKITLPVGEPPVANVTRSHVGLPEDEFVFLYVYDYHSTEARKNPTGLIRAFKDAFPPGSGAHLVLKCINADTMFAHHDRVLLEIGDHPDISFVDKYLSVGEKNALIALSDCYVSPHRSEGFGLSPAEAMLLGTPVIATNYGGVLEFLNEDNAYLVDYELVSVGEHAEPYPADAVWADPDLGQLAALMRHVFEHPEEARERAARAREEIRAGHTPVAAGHSMEPILQAHYQDLIAQGARGLKVANVAPAQLDTPGVELASVLRGLGQRGGAAEKAKWAAQRLKRPFTARRDLVSAQLLDRIRELDGRVLDLTGELERHRLAAHAEVLAQFRRTQAQFADAATHEQRRAVGASALQAKVDEHTELLDRHLSYGPTLPERFPAAGRPFSPGYGARHHAFLGEMLGREDLVRRFARLAPLPEGYGVALDERVVEFLWLLARAEGDRVLDAGSVLNHAHVLDAFLPRIGALTIATLITEDVTFEDRGVRYVSADLRTLPFDDDAFDLVVCGSTLEHVGMDNAIYGATEPRADDPAAEQRRALDELLRVAAPGARVLLTVPYGRAEDHGWLRQFDAAGLAELLDGLRAEATYYGYRAGGWQRVAATALTDAGYRNVHADDTPADDFAAAARGVACVVIHAPEG
ncbi:MAG: glycosyltransferase [Solirubrobacteraceae bacterium]